MIRKSLIAGLVFSIVMVGSSRAATETQWQADPALLADWFDPANWTAGVPTENHYAFILNGGLCHIGSGGAYANRIYIGMVPPISVRPR